MNFDAYASVKRQVLVVPLTGRDHKSDAHVHLPDQKKKKKNAEIINARVNFPVCVHAWHAVLAGSVSLGLLELLEEEKQHELDSRRRRSQ